MASTRGRRTFSALENHYIMALGSDPTIVSTGANQGTLGLGVSGLVGIWVKNDNGNTTNWSLIGSGSGVTTVAPIDSLAVSPDGATIVGNSIGFSSQSNLGPAFVVPSAQNFPGHKTFSDSIGDFMQSPFPAIAAGGTADIFAGDLDPGSPDPATGVWYQIDGSGNIRIVNSIIQDNGVEAVRAPQFMNFIGATITPNGLGVDITVSGGSSAQERETFVLTAPDIASGFVDLGFVVNHNSVIANLQGAALLMEGVGNDYTLSDAAVTRLTFDAALIPLLVVGQKLQVQYTH